MLRKISLVVCVVGVLAGLFFCGNATAAKKAPAKAATVAPSAEPLIIGKLKHTVIAADGSSGKVLKISPEGKIVWEFSVSKCHDAWLLPNGNVLAAYSGRGVGGAMEISPEKKIVWKYEQKGECQSVQRLADGNTLVADPARGRLVEVCKKGKIVKELKLKYKRGGHALMRYARKLASGNYLVAHHHNKVIREYAPDGKIVLEIKTKGPAFSALRLPNGNTMCSDWSGMNEIDPKGKVVWSMTKADVLRQMVPEGKEVAKGEAIMAGIQVLPNGNLAIANYFGHGRGARGAALFEVTREKKVVWQYTNKMALPGALGIHITDAKGPLLR
ncbi:MAG: hypothetical protein HN350_05400 [Phycisphaerales bacterium]|jgi:hypothetical protein|nr:hypothetical protein [Phycisphaerales bacterium]